MKRALSITFVLLGTAGLSNAQVSGNVSGDAARAVEAVASPSLARTLRARARVHATVARLSRELGLQAPADVTLLAHNTVTGRRAP